MLLTINTGNLVTLSVSATYAPSWGWCKHKFTRTNLLLECMHKVLPPISSYTNSVKLVLQCIKIWLSHCGSTKTLKPFDGGFGALRKDVGVEGDEVWLLWHPCSTCGSILRRREDTMWGDTMWGKHFTLWCHYMFMNFKLISFNKYQWDR